MILEELQLRLATKNNWQLRVGPITQKNILAMRSFVIEPTIGKDRSDDEWSTI
jgi:p-hydroxybenzoate 3-monooxygenase